MLTEIWQSYRTLPLWVQIWVYFLVVVNLLSAAFFKEYNSGIIAFLSYAGMIPNVFLALIQRGVSKAWSISHVFAWTLQVPIIGYYLVMGGPTSLTYKIFLIILLVTNFISLVFDYIDSIKWLLGDRKISRPEEQK